MALSPFGQSDMSIGQRLWQINWSFVLLISVTASVGFGMLYSAANGNLDPWASRQMIRFGAGVGLMLVVAVIDIHVWLRYAYAIYALSLALLVVVEFSGSIGMGAQRWIDLGVFTIQPSEIMKVSIILLLARYFYASRMEDVGRISHILMPLILMAVPAILVMRQPDLGTTILMVATGIAMLFLVGVRIWVFVAGALATIAAVIPLWQFVLLDYQKKRLLTFIDPEKDPLGAGYHILQSKIALGSGGLFGKGFLEGSQSHLSFLPEKQTDFIFTMLAEEFGLVGGLVLIGLYMLLLIYAFAISLRCRSQFGRLMGMGVSTSFFLNIFVNIAMVMGVVPVVGMPLPLISYGGTAMLTLMFSFGLLLNVYVHRDVQIGPGAADGN
ncbi:MAG: rod shape-determining protein RodA [Rhodospirillaceae bacterium]|jgi:rod shape determining protein RodA|nr:rod shape-determining protein RodA [Rhodospirillaceae bacterium]MBT7267812.1 rod shape-determining protein RodA [Rhodospirillaceae bacterium]